MNIFTPKRTFAIRLFLLLLLSCLLYPLRAENKPEQVASSDIVLHEIDSINKIIPSLNTIERRLQYEKYKSLSDSLWIDVNQMTFADKINNYRALMCTLLFLDPFQPIGSYLPYMHHLKSLSTSLPDAYLTLKLKANLTMSHVHLIALREFRAYPLLESIVQCVQKNAQVDSLIHLPKDNPHLSMLYGVLVHQLLCYKVVKDSVVQRNKMFLDSDLGAYCRSLDKCCSTSPHTKGIAYGMVDGDYHKVIDICDTLVSNQRLSGNDVLYLLKIQIDAINRLPKSPEMTRALLRGIAVQDSVLAHKEADYNTDYNSYNLLNRQQKLLSDLRRVKEKVWTQHMIIACAIAVLAVCVVLYLLLGYRKRSKMNLVFLNKMKKATESRKKALSLAEEACEQQLNLMRNFNHDLRVPMNALLGFSNILGTHDDISEHEQQEAGEIVFQTSRQLLDMVNNILDIARLSTGHMLVDYQDVSVQHLLAPDTWKDFDDRIISPHILTIANYQQDTTVYTDSKHLVRILELLVQNAILTSESGEITVCAHTDLQQERLFVDVLSPASHQSKEVIMNCLDRTKQIADYVDTNEYFLVLARMLCDLLSCELVLHDSVEEGVHMQVVIPLKQ